jgi:hypothetical protein
MLEFAYLKVDLLLRSFYSCGRDCKELPNKDHATCRKDLLEAQTARLPLSGSECSSLAGMGRGFIGGATP